MSRRHYCDAQPWVDQPKAGTDAAAEVEALREEQMRWFMGELAGPCGRRARHLVVLSHVRAAKKHPLATTMSGCPCLGSSR